MRSASSTWAGRPEAIRPETYLTSGEYATTRRSRACSSPVDLYRLHRSLSSMALTFVSKLDFLPGYASSGSRMCLCVCALEPRGLYPSVDLRRGDRGMPEHLLDRAQVGAAIEQMGGERVPQGVRMHVAGQRRLPRPHPQAPP